MTPKQKKELTFLIQKKLYKDYEDFKLSLGKENADRLYKYQIDTESSFIKEVEKIRRPLMEKQRAGTITSNESKRLEALNKMVDEDKTNKLKTDARWLEQALSEYATYEQKKTAITEHYNQERKKAIETGNAEMISGIDESEQQQLKSLQASNSQKLANMEQFADGAVYLTKKAVQQQIEILENLLKSGALPDSVTEDIKKKITGLNKLLAGPESGLVSTQLNDEIAKKEAALKKLAEAGDTSSNEFKQLNDQLMRLKQEKAENSLAGLTKRYLYCRSWLRH